MRIQGIFLVLSKWEVMKTFKKTIGVIFQWDPIILILCFQNVWLLLFVFHIQVCLKRLDIEYTKEKLENIPKSWIWTWIFSQNSRKWILLLNFYEFFKTIIFVWYISIHHLTYLDKLIKCLEMRENIKSKWYIFQLFLLKCNINVY